MAIMEWSTSRTNGPTKTGSGRHCHKSIYIMTALQLGITLRIILIFVHLAQARANVNIKDNWGTDWGLSLTRNSIDSITSPTERDVLMKFYQDTNGEDWAIKSAWGSDESICTWHGILCVNGLVTEINLNQNNLTGTIPVDLISLSALKVLRLFHNDLSGQIFSEDYADMWTTMAGPLESLDLSKNVFSGPISPTGGFTNLCITCTSINLSENYLTGKLFLF